MLGPFTPAPAARPAARTELESERLQMSRLMHGMGATASRDLPAGFPAGFAPHSPPAFMPALITLTGRIRQEMEANLSRLLSLNPGRREGVAQYLDRLAGLPQGPSAASGTSGDAAGGLRRWIDGLRSQAQNTSLQIFFEEVALIALGQAILMKAWSDRGVRAWKRDDLGGLNWALSCALKPLVPLDREGWQITRQNLYSWYNPGPAIQKDIWAALEGWRITDEDPSLLAVLLKCVRQCPTHWPELRSFDPRFFTALWENMAAFGFDQAANEGPIRRKRVVFSPTLRDGAMVRTGPASVSWIGLEANPFQLFTAELVQLWWGPAAPPLWATGTGLEVHSRDQLSLALGSPKPSLLSRITEMEACDLAFVLEERTVRANARTPEAAQLREQLDALPYFKKLRAPGTSLGDLQACVALSKLRPGGLLWWAREEPLSDQDGAEALAFLLERGKLVCEWNFSDVSHGLPVMMPLFPKYLYLLQREPDVQARLSHRPTRITLQGQIRSHVEVPLILGDALQAYHRRAEGAVSTHGHWQIHVQKSPIPQKEWSDRWPDPAAHDTVLELEELRIQSQPLGSVTTVRHTPAGDPEKNHAWSIHAVLKGLWIQATPGTGGESPRRLKAAPLPRQGHEAQGTGFMILVPDDAWIAPLGAYLESPQIQRWLEFHAERRGDRWVLNEQIVKFIPIPKALLVALGAAPGDGATSFAVPLPGEWEKLASELAYQPRLVSDKLTSLPQGEPGKRIRAALFVRAARALETLRQGQSRLLSLVGADGRIRWKELLDIFPKSENMAVTFSDQVQISGSLPLHLPIGRMERVRAPMPGILLTTESGFHLNLSSQSPRVLDILWEQLDGLTHPTWNELTQYLRLPRRLDLAEATAADIIRSHGEQSAKIRELGELLSACSNI